MTFQQAHSRLIHHLDGMKTSSFWSAIQANAQHSLLFRMQRNEHRVTPDSYYCAKVSCFWSGRLTACCLLSSLADDLVSTPPALLLPCRPFSKHEPNVNKQTKNGSRQQKTTNQSKGVCGHNVM
ncbi:hypothetical protein NCU05462 [Neurospora crassa OR74A]|uniref:Uncharacterized protein n=1 Tax=Neurospora crassa (strain ATCC 24698 / 74-OR23-1A / CBS 708.71 / DSM 1257 / FGSC 987) TaxID=367110 RepID=V5IN35_NEUCR|nr:hypothetical protein NCU05462 [Neurospora crassa OR74A]ESA43558.1 hypothetical protein NCU05462 [Neurospora crassa OR74A]|eukprot:XP_011393582.1 hypothetical protein NCU05462 [Neurospora crassa OR74A]